MKLIYRVHAIERMFDRGITEDDVQSVLLDGEEIAAYRYTTPYPGRLVLGWCGTRAIHVVVDENRADDQLIVNTAYEPQPDLWEFGFKRRKK
ncbi:MAG TPA: DUF4258 domain-containing protein [Burkholderiales bacterium]|nr:DUF4258 domain-containing protein [Burkholderiales bacterium]